MSALKNIQDTGFELELNQIGGFRIAPTSELTDDRRDYLRSHKKEILVELTTIEVISCRIADTPELEQVVITKGMTTEEAEEYLRKIYGDRLLTVKRKTAYKY